MNKRGSLPALVGIAVPMVLVVGTFAIDATRFWLHQAHLQTALDAGALIAARDIDNPNRDANVKAVVVDIFNENAPADSKLTAADVQVTQVGTDKVQVTASKGINPLLGNAVKLDNLPASLTDIMTASRGATAQRSSTGTELALVFDITLSMVAGDEGVRRIDGARRAGLELLKVLYDDLPDNKNGTPNANNKKWLENLFVSVIPFATAVNYGEANTHFLGPDRSTDNYVRSWSGNMTSWGGCVEMRDLSFGDRTPRGSDGGLARYFAPGTYDPSKKYVKNLDPGETGFQCRVEASYQDKLFVEKKRATAASYHNVCMGHNDWNVPTQSVTPSEVFSGKQNALIKTMVTWDSHETVGLDPWRVAHGPNMMCPTEDFQVLPLTRDRAVIEGRIRKMETNLLPFSAGTNIAPGLMAGWFTLSPNWRKREGSEAFDGWSRTSMEPPTTPDTRPPLPALPRDYHLPNRQKVLILLTDGDNTWFNAHNFQGNVNSLVRPESAGQAGFGFYGAYGNLDGHLDATSIADGVSKVNAEAVKWCQKIRTPRDATKAAGPGNPEQITVYTVSFGPSVSGAAQTVLRNCASADREDSTKRLHFHAPDEKTLREIFKAIGAELSRLRLLQ